MAFFEHVILLKQDLSSSEIENVIKTHEDTLNELNGNIVYNDYPMPSIPPLFGSVKLRFKKNNFMWVK